MLDSSDETALKNSGVMYFINLLITTLIILMYLNAPISSICIPILFIGGATAVYAIGWFIFYSLEKLGLNFFIWNVLTFMVSIISVYVCFFIIWEINLSGPYVHWAGAFFLFGVFVISLLIKIFDKKSTYGVCLTRGRFKEGKFNFDSSVWLPIEPSQGNSILLSLGLNGSALSIVFRNKWCKFGYLLTTIILLFLLIYHFHLIDVMFLLLLVAWLSCVLYIVATNYVVDLLYCLVAGTRK